MRGPAKWVFHKPRWEIFAMVSIQIWVTRFHICCTGELEQVCLAAVTGSPFFSTGLESDAKYAGYDKRCSCPEHSVVKPHHSDACCQCHPGRHGSPGAAKPEAIQSRPKESEAASREWVTLSASHDGWQQFLLEQVCFGFWGCNHRWLLEGRDSSRGVCYCHTVRNYIDLSHEVLLREQWKSGRCVGLILNMSFCFISVFISVFEFKM